MTLYANVDARGNCTRQPSLQLTRLEAVKLMSVLSNAMETLPERGTRSIDIPLDAIVTRRR